MLPRNLEAVVKAWALVGHPNAWCYGCGIHIGTAIGQDIVPAMTRCACGHYLDVRRGRTDRDAEAARPS